MTDEVVAKVATMGEAAFAKALAFVEATEVFVLDQAPLLVQEILAYGLVFYTVWAVVCGLALVGMVFGYIKCLKTVCRSNGELDGEYAAWFSILGVVLAIAPVIGFIECSLAALKISVAPRLFLVQFFADMA